MEHSAAAALARDELTGDNQYYCEVCACKRDADRQMALRSAPPYLCLSLQRFVFDLRTLDKKKATDKLGIPLSLDLAQVLWL